MDRIKMDNLENLVGFINRIVGAPEEEYTKNEDGTFTHHKENYHIDGAYGGHRLEKDGSDPLCTGYVSKKELYNAMQAFKEGLLAKKQEVTT